MKSHLVLKSVVESVGAKQVAHDLKISSSWVHKWCSEPPTDVGNDGSGARNPPDRLLERHSSTRDPRPIEIDEIEAARIREERQLLQSRGEAFVRACEIGVFDPER